MFCPMTPQIETEGLRAYEQARAFERLRSWRLPLSYAVFLLFPILSCIVMWKDDHMTMAALNFMALVFLAWAIWWHWRKLKARHEKNLQLLAKLKGTYGNQLPWIKMENHFAALEQLKQDLAREKVEAE